MQISGRPARSLGHIPARVCTLLLLASPSGIALLAGPITVPRGEPQLFVDDELIAGSHALQRTLRQPRKEGGGLVPVLAIPQSFGRQTALQASQIIYDPRLRLWVMFCLARLKNLAGTEDGWRSVALVRFTSADGLNWRSDASDGLERLWPRTREDLYDPVSKAYSPQMDFATVCFVASDPVWPYQAWFWIAGGQYLKDRKGWSPICCASPGVNSSGAVTVEALDDSGAVLGAAKLAGDGVRQVVRFDGKSLRNLQGARDGLRLRFMVESGAALYAFVID